jgi:hypothetical protein
MKTLWLVLALGLSGCVLEVEDKDMTQGNPQYAKSGGWSNSAVLRNNGSDNMGLAVNFLAGRTNNETPSKNYTVQFSVGNTTVPPSAGPPPSQGGQPIDTLINPVAEISWSVEGNTIRRVVSVTNGAAVTGVGQGVKIVVTDQTLQSSLAIDGAALYRVDITVAPGSRPSENQPATFNPRLATGTSTIDVPPGGPATGVAIDIPINAGVISTFVTAVPNDFSAIPQNTAIVSMLNNSNVLIRNYDPNEFTGFVPVTATCARLLLINNMPVGPGVPTLNFAVTFGIDG